MPTPIDHIRGFHDLLTGIRRDLHAHPGMTATPRCCPVRRTIWRRRGASTER